MGQTSYFKGNYKKTPSTTVLSGKSLNWLSMENKHLALGSSGGRRRQSWSGMGSTTSPLGSAACLMHAGWLKGCRACHPTGSISPSTLRQSVKKQQHCLWRQQQKQDQWEAVILPCEKCVFVLLFIGLLALAKYHRMLRVGSGLKDRLVPTPALHGLGHLLDQVAQGLKNPTLFAKTPSIQVSYKQYLSKRQSFLYLWRNGGMIPEKELDKNQFG